jgi:hypothetical protein
MPRSLRHRAGFFANVEIIACVAGSHEVFVVRCGCSFWSSLRLFYRLDRDGRICEHLAADLVNSQVELLSRNYSRREPASRALRA